jgi:hypothetical protein
MPKSVVAVISRFSYLLLGLGGSFPSFNNLFGGGGGGEGGVGVGLGGGVCLSFSGILFMF